MLLAARGAAGSCPVPLPLPPGARSRPASSAARTAATLAGPTRRSSAALSSASLSLMKLPAPDNFINDKRSEEHTSELQSRLHLACRLLLEKKNASWGDQ